VLAALHRTGYLWRTFVDHSNACPHFDARTDKLIVLPESIGTVSETEHQLRPPVDHDLALSLEQSVPFWEDPLAVDPSIGTVNIAAQPLFMLQSVGGRAWNTGLEKREQPADEWGTVLWALREIAVREALRSYQAPLVPLDGEVGPGATEAYALVKEALELTRE
jgi:hypothetical protein